MFDMMKMMGKMKEVQQKMKEAQEQLKDIHTVGEAGGGMVRATANGKKELIGLDMDESLMNVKDKDMLRDLVIAAANKALASADEKGKEHIKKSTEGLIPNIPGLDLSGLG
ncbi:MAG: YbaB/EbfC family nucleoid-associated protein [Bacteroidota bacterium]